VPREIKDQEYRVALLPSAAYQLIKRGHQVVAERGAGAGCGYPDGDYEQAGAVMVDRPPGAFAQADLVVNGKEPQPSDYPLWRPGEVVVQGGGEAGINAARMATRLRADVTLLVADLVRMPFLDITLHTAPTLYSDGARLVELLPNVDLLIAAVLVPAAKAPKLI